MTGEAIASHAASRAGLVNHLTDQNLVAVAQTTSLDHWYAVVADEDVKNVSDLVGRKVALALGTASDTLWAAVVAEAGIDPASVEIVNLEPPEMVAAISRGDIDAFVAWEPWVSKSTLTIPGTHVLRDGGGLLTDGTYIYMNRKWIEENKESAIRFIKAMAAANDFIVSKPEETQKLVGEFLRVDSVLMAALYPKLNYHMKLDEQSLGISKESVRQLQKSGRIENAEDFDYGKWFYPDLLKSVHPDAVSLQIR
jgi:ABC-type nitrate/sulfonate/bicarbonate transport system substrate-binding protein